MRVHGKSGEWNAGDWNGIRTTRYKCPRCHKFVKPGWIFCPYCAQKIEFPKIDFTPYVPGERQKVIVVWAVPNEDKDDA